MWSAEIQLTRFRSSRVTLDKAAHEINKAMHKAGVGNEGSLSYVYDMPSPAKADFIHPYTLRRSGDKWDSLVTIASRANKFTNRLIMTEKLKICINDLKTAIIQCQDLASDYFIITIQSEIEKSKESFFSLDHLTRLLWSDVMSFYRESKPDREEYTAVAVDLVQICEFMAQSPETRERAYNAQFEKYVYKVVNWESISLGESYIQVREVVHTFWSDFAFKHLYNNFQPESAHDLQVITKNSYCIESILHAARQSSKASFFDFTNTPRVAKCFDYFRESCTRMTNIYEETDTYKLAHVDFIELLGSKISFDPRFRITYAHSDKLAKVAFHAAMAYLYVSFLRKHLKDGLVVLESDEFAKNWRVQVMYHTSAFDQCFNDDIRMSVKDLQLHNINSQKDFDNFLDQLIKEKTGGKTSFKDIIKKNQASSSSEAPSEAPYIKAPRAKPTPKASSFVPPRESKQEQKANERARHIARSARLLLERNNKGPRYVKVTEEDVLANIAARVEMAENNTPIVSLEKPEVFQFSECCICLYEAASVTIKPCNHRCICAECSKLFALSACPICRTAIEKFE
ncbi:MAG: hypothetical protein CMI56_00075 [Parcubacteria group bacterium]|nr:hypothetical protein [Parcubacteria group bacterium]|tara:strand:+ start:2894 stop:4606 length:1713 start_codon:yes stop_codon:yes gene_type:complete